MVADVSFNLQVGYLTVLNAFVVVTCVIWRSIILGQMAHGSIEALNIECS